MSEPSAESLAVAEDHYGISDRATRLAIEIDAHVAKRTAELRKIIHDQSEAHVAHMKGVDESNERRLDAYKARLDALRAAADAMEAVLAQYMAGEDDIIVARGAAEALAAYRALSPAGEEHTEPQRSKA